MRNHNIIYLELAVAVFATIAAGFVMIGNDLGVMNSAEIVSTSFYSFLGVALICAAAFLLFRGSGVWFKEVDNSIAAMIINGVVILLLSLFVTVFYLFTFHGSQLSFVIRFLLSALFVGLTVCGGRVTSRYFPTHKSLLSYGIASIVSLGIVVCLLVALVRMYA